MTRLILGIWGLAALAIAVVYGLVLFATLEAADELFYEMTSLYDEAHEFLPVDPGAFPLVPREGYDAVGDELAALGFVHLGSMEDRTVSDVLPEMRTYLDVYVNDSGDVFCATYRIQTPQYDQQIVEFESQFDDGTFLATTNSIAAGWMAAGPEIDTEITEYFTTEQLSMRHSERVEKRGEPTRTVRSLEDVLVAQSAFNAFEMQHRRSVGYLTYDELVAMSGQDAGSVYLPGTLQVLHWIFNRRVDKRRAPEGASRR